MKNIQFMVCFLLAMFLCGFGCASKPILDPLAGWQKNYNSRPSDQVIENDIQDYIKGLGLKPHKAGAIVIYGSEDGNEFVVSTDYFEDGTG